MNFPLVPKEEAHLGLSACSDVGPNRKRQMKLKKKSEVKRQKRKLDS